MDNKKLSFALKSVIVFLAFLGVGLYLGIIPIGLYIFVEQYKEFENFFFPWLIVLSVSSVPLFVILGLGFAVSNEISRDNSFSSINVKYLNGVSSCLIVEAIYFFAGNLVLWFLNLNYPIIVLFSLALSLFTVAIAAAVNVLANLVNKAVKLREDNEAII